MPADSSPRSPRAIGWTGERCVPWADDVQVVYEHLHRYRFAADFAKGKQVIDLGSGEGYGAAILAERAERVTAVEIDPDAIAHSRATYAAPNLEFVEGSILDLDSIPAGPYDLVVCFEVIEHLAEQERLMGVIERLLAPDGILIVSTPDRAAYEWARAGEPNPFHVRELTRAEFAALLRARFPHVAVWGQRTGAGSQLLPLDVETDRGPATRFTIAPEGDTWASDLEPAPIYLLAAASRSPLPSVPDSSTLTDPTLQIAVREPSERRDARVRAAGGGRTRSPAVSIARRLRDSVLALRAQPDRISFREVAEPAISIVIPVYGRAAMTLDCLASVAANPPAEGFEVIVVDDASRDRTARLMRKVDGLRLIRNDRNLGFLDSASRGIEEARGRYVLLLNNDAQPEPGAIDAMRRTLEREPRAGIVGGKLVYPDGRLQEAGGIVWSDGSAQNYGRGADPDLPQFSYLREVDYVSGAALMVRREVLDAAGGLDRRFSPAYYEDTDLAFRARSLGYRVIYQPRAVFVHREGATQGIDPARGLKQYQERNARLFKEKWSAELRSQYAYDREIVGLARDRRTGPRALVIDDRVPTPDRDSGSQRMLSILEALTELGIVVSFLPADRENPEPHTSNLQEMGVEVLYGDAGLEATFGAIRSACRLCLISRPSQTSWQALGLLRAEAPEVTVLYDTVDLHYVREGQRAELESDQELAHEAAVTRRLELALGRGSDAMIAITEDEAAKLGEELPDTPAYVLPNAHRATRVGPPFGDRHDLLFVGGFAHTPNVDAVQYMVAEIMPHVWRELPDLRLLIVGGEAPPEVLRLASDRVDVMGWIPDLAPVYARTRVTAVPLRFGAGMKGKVGESMAYGVPVVTTTIGAEGIGIEDGKQALVVDDPEDFAASVVRLYCDEALWEAVAGAGRQLVEERYSPETLRERLRVILSEQGITV